MKHLILTGLALLAILFLLLKYYGNALYSEPYYIQHLFFLLFFLILNTANSFLVEVQNSLFQVLVFGAQRSNVVEYFESNNIALKHLLLRNWEAGYETLPYPPAIGAYAVYNKNDLYDSIEYAWSRVSLFACFL